MYDTYDYNTTHHAQRAYEIDLRVRQEEKQMALMNALLHRKSTSGWMNTLKKVRALLSSLIASL
jgi:hypothetical protein